MTADERDRIEARAVIDAQVWRDLYPSDYRDPPSQNAVGRAFAYSWKQGRLGAIGCSQEAYATYYTAYMRSLGFATGNA